MTYLPALDLFSVVTSLWVAFFIIIIKCTGNTYAYNVFFRERDRQVH